MPKSTDFLNFLSETTRTIAGYDGHGSKRTAAYVSPSVIKGASLNNPNIRQANAELIQEASSSWYSPVTSYVAFQLPANRIDQYLYIHQFASFDPKVAAGIDFYTYYPFNGFTLECPYPEITEHFDKLVDRLNLQKTLTELSHSFHLYGDAFAYGIINCPVCRGNGVVPGTRYICNHEKATWQKIELLEPSRVQKMPTIPGAPAMYSFMPNDEMMQVVQMGDSHPYAHYVSDTVKGYIEANEPIPLDPRLLEHFKRASDSWQPYGESLIKRLLPTLIYKDKIRQAQSMIVDRHAVPLRIAMLGSDTRPATQTDIENTRDQLTGIANDQFATIVTHHNFDYKLIGADGHTLPMDTDIVNNEDQILDGMMIHKALLTGEGPSYESASVGLIVLARRLEAFRNEVKRWLEHKIFKQEAEWQGFTKKGKLSDKEPIYPTVKFNNLELTNKTSFMQAISQVVGQTKMPLSMQTMCELIDVDYDQEVERIRAEQSWMPNSTNVSMGGYAAVAGPAAGVGAMGAGMGMAGVDMTGMGMAPEMAGGAPAAAPMPPMGGAPMAQSNQRVAAVYGELRQNAEAFDGVTGRARLGFDLPHNNEQFTSLRDDGLGGANAVPMNDHAKSYLHSLTMYAPTRYANQHTTFKQTGPTSLERKLYAIVLGMNPPIPFFAQYQVDNYYLDGAFPTLHLGLEADSKKFHSSQEDIARDKKRDAHLQSQGWTILRFTEEDLTYKADSVQSMIAHVFKQLAG